MKEQFKSIEIYSVEIINRKTCKDKYQKINLTNNFFLNTNSI